MFQLGWKHHLDDDWGAALKESSKGRWYSCIQGAQEVPSLELHTFTTQVVLLAWNAATPSNRNKEDVGLCFSIRLLFLYYHCNEGLGQRSWINGRYPMCFSSSPSGRTQFIELRTSATRSSSVLHIEVIAKKKLLRSMDGSSTRKLGSGLEAGCLYFSVLFEQAGWHDASRVFFSNTSPWCYCRLASWLDWCAWDLRGLQEFCWNVSGCCDPQEQEGTAVCSKVIWCPVNDVPEPKWCQENKLPVISLFSGIAGLELGLSKSNSQVLTMGFIIQGK